MHCNQFNKPLFSSFDAAVLCYGLRRVGVFRTSKRGQCLTTSTEKTSFYASAKNVIFLYMDGGPSHVDIFDYKPALEKYNGRNPKEVIGKLAPTQFDNIGKILKSPWDFKQRGQCGHWVSDLFPHIAQDDVIDEISMVKSMTSNFSEHTSANYFFAHR